MKVRQEVRSKICWAAALVTAGAVAWALCDYAKWRSLGPGGLPANVRGWLTMSRYRLIARDKLDAGPLLARAGAADDLRAWSKARRRIGTRPEVSPYPIPHRQLDQLPDHGLREKLSKLFDRTAGENADRVEYALSHFEKRHRAITLKAPAGMVGSVSYGEIAHIHPSDSSMHMILSPSDAVAAVEMGWAERHGLAGIAVGLPATYVMVYAPRNESDLMVVGELLEAAIGYATQPASFGVRRCD
jgi:hypothetical protein